MQVTIRSDLQGLKQTGNRAGNLRPLLKIWGQIGRSSIIRNFEVGGRPKRWKPSIRVRKKGGLTLVLSGRLRQSIAGRPPEVTDTTVAIGTNAVYARIHQLGGIIETGPSKRRTLVFSAGGRFMSRKDASRRKKGAIQVRFAQSGGAYIPIEARPFLMLQTEDLVEMKQAAIAYLAGK